MSRIAFAERAVYLPPFDALVVTDLHVGRAEASAVSLPLGERDDLTDRLAGLFSRFDPDRLVVAGDAVHTFDRVSDRSRETLDGIREACAANGTALELVGGNHDAALASAWDEPVRDVVVLDPDDADDPDARRTAICHGHEPPKPPDPPAERYVIGHVHPTIEIEGARHPCFLHGEGVYRGSDLLVLPAFTRLAPGVVVNDMRTEGFASPLVTDADRLAPIVYDAGPDSAAGSEALRFPPLGECRGLL